MGRVSIARQPIRDDRSGSIARITGLSVQKVVARDHDSIQPTLLGEGLRAEKGIGLCPFNVQLEQVDTINLQRRDQRIEGTTLDLEPIDLAERASANPMSRPR